MTRRPSRRSLWPRAAVLLLTAALFSAHVATPAPAFAQIRRYAAEDPSVTAIYGRGVHAYFAGQLAAAEQQLSQAIDAGSRDPRVYYFRAMTRLRMGRGREAQHDMQMGAALEAKNPGQRRSINQALVRVQGNDRKTLENYRRLAKLQLAQENRQLAARKYGAATPQGPQRGVVRQPARVPMEALVGEPSIRVVRPYGTPSSSPAPLEAPALSPPVAQQQPIETPTTVQGDAGVAPAEAVVPAEPQIGDSAPPRADQDERPLGVDVPATDQFAEDAADPSEEDAFGGFGELEVPAVETPDFPAEEGDAEPVAAADEPADEATEVDADGDLFGFDPETETPSEEFPAADDELTAETEGPPSAATSADQPDPKNFLGVLGRIVGSATPKIAPPELPNLPSMGPAGGAEPQADDFDFGPEVEFEGATGDFGAEMPAEEPEAPAATEQSLPEADVEEEPFGEDPFGGFGAEEEEAPSDDAADQGEDEAADEAPAEESEEPAEEDAAEEDADAESEDPGSDDEASEDEEADSDHNPLEDGDDPFGGFGDF